MNLHSKLILKLLWKNWKRKMNFPFFPSLLSAWLPRFRAVARFFRRPTFLPAWAYARARLPVPRVGPAAALPIIATSRAPPFLHLAGTLGPPVRASSSSPHHVRLEHDRTDAIRVRIRYVACAMPPKSPRLINSRPSQRHLPISPQRQPLPH